MGPGADFAHLYPDVMASVTPERLQRLAAALLKPPPVLDLSHVTPIRFTVSDAIVDVERSLTEVREARFRELVADCEERIQVVVRFLALLELYRDGKIEVEQAETFGELRVRWAGSTAG